MDELSEFVEQQGVVTRKRLAVQEKRTELKRSREAVSRRDIILIDKVRRFVTDEKPSHDDDLLKFFEEALEARDLVGPLEADYEPLEIDLGAEETKLQKKYSDLELRFEHFFRLKVTSTHPSAPSTIEFEDGSTTGSTPAGNDDNGKDTGHLDLLYGALVGEEVRIGQVPMFTRGTRGRDSFDHQHVLPDKKKASSPSDTPDIALRQHSTISGDHTATDELPVDLIGIASAEDNSMTMSQELLVPNDITTLNLSDLVTNMFLDVSDDPDPWSDDFPTDPGLQEVDSILLREDDIENGQARTKLSEYLLCFDNTCDRVNQWLLHQLRISPRQTYALRREVLDCFAEISDWANLSLEEWSNDQLGHRQPYYQGSIEDGSEDPEYCQLQDPISPVPSPISQRHPYRHRPRSSLLSNAALAPTVSDLHNRSLSTPQGGDISAIRFLSESFVSLG